MGQIIGDIINSTFVCSPHSLRDEIAQYEAVVVKVEIEGRDGSRYSSEVLHVPGSPLFPLTWSELEEKYRECVGQVVSPGYIEKSVSMIKNFENIKVVSDLINIKD